MKEKIFTDQIGQEVGDNTKSDYVIYKDSDKIPISDLIFYKKNEGGKDFGCYPCNKLVHYNNFGADSDYYKIGFGSDMFWCGDDYMSIPNFIAGDEGFLNSDTDIKQKLGSTNKDYQPSIYFSEGHEDVTFNHQLLYVSSFTSYKKNEDTQIKVGKDADLLFEEEVHRDGRNMHELEINVIDAPVIDENNRIPFWDEGTLYNRYGLTLPSKKYGKNFLGIKSDNDLAECHCNIAIFYANFVAGSVMRWSTQEQYEQLLEKHTQMRKYLEISCEKFLAAHLPLHPFADAVRGILSSYSFDPYVYSLNKDSIDEFNERNYELYELNAYTNQRSRYLGYHHSPNDPDELTLDGHPVNKFKEMSEDEDGFIYPSMIFDHYFHDQGSSEPIITFYQRNSASLGDQPTRSWAEIPSLYYADASYSLTRSAFNRWIKDPDYPNRDAKLAFGVYDGKTSLSRHTMREYLHRVLGALEYVLKYTLIGSLYDQAVPMEPNTTRSVNAFERDNSFIASSFVAANGEELAAELIDLYGLSSLYGNNTEILQNCFPKGLYGTNSLLTYSPIINFRWPKDATSANGTELFDGTIGPPLRSFTPNKKIRYNDFYDQDIIDYVTAPRDTVNFTVEI